MRLDVAFEFLAVFLIGRQRGAVGFEAPQVRFQSLFEIGDVFGKRGDFFFERCNPLIQRLELGHQMSIWMHGTLS